MTRLLPTFRALLEALEALGHAKKPTTQQIHRACESFVDMVAELLGQRVTLVIGQTVIAREHERTTDRMLVFSRSGVSSRD